MFTKFRPSIINQIRHIQRQRRPTGKRTSATTECPGRSSKFFEYEKSKTFSRQMLLRYGQHTIDDAILILNPGAKTKIRQLDEKKRKQLSLLYFENVAPIICELPDAANAGVVITKVDTPNHLKEVKIWWKSYGDERDVRIKNLLDSNVEEVRKKLSTQMYHSNVPPIKFIPDRSQLVVDEMNQLFQAADYGMQYRAVSHTAAVLGEHESGIPSERKVAKVPRFLLAVKAKIEEKKRRIAAAEKEAAENSPSDTDHQ